MDSDPAERVGHGGPTPDWPGGQEGPPEQGGQRADRYVFTADPEKPTPARGALLWLLLGNLWRCQAGGRSPIIVPMDLRADLVRHYGWLRRYGLNDSHSGNASVRVADAVWVTPTGACADTLEQVELVVCPIEGPPGPGASLDAPLHLAVYQRNPEHGALLHSHGPYTVALTLGGGDYDPPDFEAQYYFGRVRVLDIPYERYLSDAPAAVADALKDHPITIVRGHGVYAAAPTLNLAYKWTCSLELSARTAYLAYTVGTLRRPA